MTTPLAALRRRGAALLAFTTIAAVVLTTGGPAGAAIVTVPLGTAVNYPVLGYSTVTNANSTVIDGGNVGLFPGSSITGFDPVTGPGIILAPGFADAASPEAGLAQDAVTNAYTNARNRPVTATLAVDLGNAPGALQGGVYESTAHGAFGLTGTLVLDGAGNRNTVFIFQSGSTLTTAANSVVQLINGAQECNVFWQLDSSATLGTDSVFVGNILAHDAVTVTSRVTVHGRAFASNAAVTLDDDVFTPPTCQLTAPTTTSGGGGTTTTAAGTATTAPGGGTATTLPGGGTGTTVPGAGTPTLPGTPPGSPGVPPIAGPPRTGGGPAHGATFPWLAVLFAGVFGTAALGGTVRARRIRARGLATRMIPGSPSRR